MRRWITPIWVAPAVAVVALIGACQATAESPATMVPRIINATTIAATTSIPATTSTSAAQVSSTMVYKADPATLQRLPGVEPIGTGDAAGGVASPNGRWLALAVWREDVIDELIVIDTRSWEVVQRSPSFGRIVGVDDEGTVYALRTDETILVRRLLIDSVDWRSGAELDSGGYWDVDMLGHGILGGLLYPTAGERTIEEPMLIVVDTRTGDVKEMPLPGLRAGGVPTEIVLEGGERVFETYEPEVVWDDDRALVVHADADAVTEVNLATGETLRHEYSPKASILDRFLLWLSPPAQAKGPRAGVTRSTQLNRNTGYLYVSGYRQDVFVDADGDLHETRTPMGIDVVDTERWVREARLDLPVGQVQLSPDGSTLIGTGTTEVGISNRFEIEGSGVYLISTKTLEYNHLDRGPELETRVDFSADGSYLYMTDPTSGANIDVVNQETLKTVASIQGCWVEVWGTAGVVYEWTGCRTSP